MSIAVKHCEFQRYNPHSKERQRTSRKACKEDWEEKDSQKRSDLLSVQQNAKLKVIFMGTLML